MSVYYRYFRIKDEATNASIKEYFKRAKVYAEHITEIVKSVGATGARQYNGSGSFAGFIFPKGHVVDMTIYKETKTGKSYLPKKNCKAGKELWKLINAMKPPGDIDNSLSVVGHSEIAFFHGMRLYRNSVCGAPKCGYFAVIPWQDIDPKILADYKKDSAGGLCCDGELDHLQWVPPVEWEEIKEWELKKELAEARVGEK